MSYDLDKIMLDLTDTLVRLHEVKHEITQAEEDISRIRDKVFLLERKGKK